MFHALRHGLAALLLLAVTLPAAAAEQSRLQAFNLQVGAADHFYRSAGFYLHTGNAGLAAVELQSMQAQWQELMTDFTDPPPDAFAADPAYHETLKAVAGHIQAALAALEANDTDTAEAELKPIRQELADLRARNNIRVFSDCVDDMRAAMDALWVYRRDPPAFDDPAQMDAIKARGAVVEHLIRQCQAETPPRLADNADYRRLMNGSLDSIRSLGPALRAKNETAVVNVLRELRSFINMVYLQFG